MAIMDYGALTWKDGVLLSETEYFDDMQKMVGWSDDGKENQLANNWFSYIGDDQLTIAFYKYCMRIYCPEDTWYNETVYFGSENYVGWRKWERIFIIGDHMAKLTIKKSKWNNCYYFATLRYKGHKWKVTFGSGVCYDTYTKYHIICAWNMPLHKWFKIKMNWGQFKQYDLYHPSQWKIIRWFRLLKWRMNKYD